ncbi:MAG: winged helix-turn-helix domain-containing protein [Paraglaciecola sp.]|uniref:winged helix-turn-helix domain-containing protein n=1 Tax=Paraglaciecola sp. TaxID=1920173 RepID=UPI003298FE52
MKYLVADFEIDTTQFQITFGTTAISVEPKVFDLLVYLIENRGRLVTRDELFDKIWAGREVSDTTLSNHVKSARKALGDNGDLQQVIKTVRGRGYQFIAEVLELPSANHAQNQPSVALNKLGRLPKLAFVFIALMLLVIAFWWPTGTTQLDVESDTRPYILVVPFSVSGGDREKWQPFADQITREVILKLRQISGLRVIPASSAFTFKHNKSPEYIRKRLPEVDYLLDARVSVDVSQSIQITTELESLIKDDLIWNDHYRSRIDNTNFFSVQTDIAASVSDTLKVVILAKEQSALSELPTTNLKAYELYVAGQKQLNLLTYDSLKRSIELFSQAIKLDPHFEAAYVAKADAFRIIMSYFEKPVEVLPDVVDSVLAALEIRPDSAEALSSLGLAYVFAWRWEDAWKVLNAARKEDPNLALTEVGFALYYSGIGDVEGVYRSLEKANQLDPLNIELADWGHWALAMIGENSAAIQWAKNQIQLHPEVGLIYSGASVSASIAGDHKRAISLAQKGVLLDSGSAYSLLALAQTYGHAGELDKIPPLLMQAQSAGSYLCPYETAITYLLLNQTDKAFELFNEAIAYRSNCLVFTRFDPRLNHIKSDPRYLALLTRVGLDDGAVRQYSR